MIYFIFYVKNIIEKRNIKLIFILSYICLSNKIMNLLIGL